jgi:lysophospholipase L1-like esterase
MKAGMLRKIVTALTLVIFGAAVGLVLAEVTVALVYPQKVLVTRASVNFFVQPDPELGWVNRKGVVGQVESPDENLPPSKVRINGQGFRGREVQLPKPNGSKRILFLGDSNTFGYGVDEEARFSNLLERRLDDYDTVNLGVFGYGTDQEAILLEREGLRFSPDLVIVGLSPGDLTDNMCSIYTGISKPYCTVENGRIKLNNVPVPNPGEQTLVKRGARVREALYRHSHLYRLVAERLNESRIFMPDSVSEMSQDEGMRVTVAILDGMNRVCRESGCSFAVLLLSHGAWIEAMGRDQRQDVGYYPVLTRMLASRGITVIDTTDKFVAESRNGEKLFFDHDPVHLNGEGNRAAAESLHEGLIRYGLLP